MLLERPAMKDSNRGWIEGVHRGMDYGWGNGDQVLAAAPGRVVAVQDGYAELGDGGKRTDNGGWGNRIVIEHAPGVQTAYAHVKNGTITVKVGDVVTAGQVLARMGNNGISTAKHLHFELYLNGVRVDPAPYFTRHLPGTGTTAGETTPPTTYHDESEEDDIMRLLYVTDDCDGNGKPGWVLLNLVTGTPLPLVNDGKRATQETANSWARVNGSARLCTRQDMLNTIAAIAATAP